MSQRSAARDDLLAAVERSPAAAGAHDRAAWVGLFARDGRIEDPVGSRPHRGTDAIARFYDTFIGPRDIVFHRDFDVVDGLTVVRSLNLEVTMAASLTMTIPAYLRYDLEARGDGFAITRLRAHWALPAMVLQFARGGRAAVPAGVALTRGLLRNQGPVGALGFAAGFRGVGTRGAHHVVGLLDALCAGDEVAVRRRLPDRAPITLGETTKIGTSALVDRLRGGRWHGPIAAGHVVAVGVEADGRRGVLFADTRARPLAVTGIRLFMPAE